MRKRILIITQLGDAHAYAVARALSLKGAEPILWHTSDFPGAATETIELSSGRARIAISGPAIDLVDPEPAAVWNRRPFYVVDRDALHPADRDLAELGCKALRKSLFEMLSPEAFWVNRQSAVSRMSKLLQQRLAIEVGLATPDTLYTNDPAEIREFIKSHGGAIAFKPFEALPWKAAQTAWVPYTSALTERDLVDDDLLRAVPAIYQELVPKAWELRVTVMGRTSFAAKIHSQETIAGKLDWRMAYHELTMAPTRLPREIEQMCFELMARLGLVFGCFDFIMTPSGELVFLEVNQMGQFIFVERYTGLPLVDAFSELLLSESAGFEWQPAGNPVAYAAVEASVIEMIRQFPANHQPIPEPVWREDDDR